MKLKFVFLIMMSIGLANCRSKPPKEVAHPNKTAEAPVSSIESKQLASEEESNYVTEIAFKKEQDTLSAASKKEIQSLLNKAAKDGKIEKVELVTWADKEYPSVYSEHLSRKDRDLVDKRNHAITKYIHSLNTKIKTEEVSMAERPGMFKRMLAPDEARIKKSLETNGIPNTDTSVKTPGKASRSIIIVNLEE